MWMPFGKRRLTSAVEFEFEQSCVTLSFYLMSLAAVICDGRASLETLSLLCIALILWMSQAFSPAHTCSIFVVAQSFLCGIGALRRKVTQ